MEKENNGVQVSFFDRLSHFMLRFSYVRTLKHKYIIHVLKKDYADLIQRYKNYTPPIGNESSSVDKGIIWSMWWQGEESCPEVVKLCLASMRQHCGSHRLILITKDNYQEYISLPAYIIEKVNSGIITFTHFSDIIRVNLLAKHGGMWMDSTLFVADEIPEEIFSLEHFTIRRVKEPDLSNITISFSRWTGYCWAVRDSQSLLFSFVSELFSEYWKTHDRLIDYVLIDYSIALAFEEFPEFYEAWRRIPVNNVNCWGLARGLINKEWDAEAYAKLRESTYFFKLSWKSNLDTVTPSGKETTYGHLLHSIGEK